MSGELERQRDVAAELVLKARERVEAGIHRGDIPVWVLEACNLIEKAALEYGVLSEQISQTAAPPAVPEDADRQPVSIHPTLH